MDKSSTPSVVWSISEHFTYYLTFDNHGEAEALSFNEDEVRPPH